jgi:hypothetical protein
MHSDTEPCEKCGKRGYYKMGLCKGCRQFQCGSCMKVLTKTYLDQKLCHVCKRIKREKEAKVLLLEEV